MTAEAAGAEPMVATHTVVSETWFTATKTTSSSSFVSWGRSGGSNFFITGDRNRYWIALDGWYLLPTSVSQDLLHS